MRKRSFINIVGVDLGGGKSKNTAVVTLRVDAHAGVTVTDMAPRPGAEPLYDATLIERLRGFGDGTLVCIDAPLTLPPCLRCRVPVCPGQETCVDPAVLDMRRMVSEFSVSGRDARRGKPSVTPYTQRPTEVHLLCARGLSSREAMGQGTGPLAARAAHVTRALGDRFRLNENLIEVSPRATLGVLGFGQRFKKHLFEREERARILDEIGEDLRFGPGVWRELCVQSDHLFEAVICAYTGFLWARDGWTDSARRPAGRDEEGWIWVPPSVTPPAVLSASSKR